MGEVPRLNGVIGALEQGQPAFVGFGHLKAFLEARSRRSSTA
jgi:hypothetical protein